MKSSTKVLLGLHLLLMVYSVSSVCSKFAAATAFPSWQFFCFYGLVLGILGVYAIGWQQVIKRMPLTTAYANKAVTIVWGIVFGMVVFGETVTPLMLVGALVIVAGIVLFALEEGRVQAETACRLNDELEGPDVYLPSSAEGVGAGGPGEGVAPQGAEGKGGGRA